MKSAETMFTVVEALQDFDGAGDSELVTHLSILKSIANRHLSTLANTEYAVKEGDRYRIGLRFMNLGEYARTQKEVHRIVAPLVEELATKTEERALFMLEEHGRAVCLYIGKGKHAVKTDSYIGTRRYLNTIAGEKAILVTLPEPRVREILDQQGLREQTPDIITDRDTLFEELERIRERGVAFNREECIGGLRAVAAPIVGTDGTVQGALSVSGAARRMKGSWFEAEIPDLLLGTTDELEINIAHSY